MNDMPGIECVESNDVYFALSGLVLLAPGFRGDALGYYITSLWD
jgi:hypothetical protein